MLTKTATVHAAAWKETFDEIPARPRGAARRGVRAVRPVADYDGYVDGRPRYDGVRCVPWLAGHRAAAGRALAIRPSAETVDGLGNRKNEILLRLIHERGVEPYEGSVRYVKAARERGLSARGRLLEHELPRRARRRAASRSSSKRSSTAWSPSASI